MTDERPNSLAAQAASWVPPWERAPREPDRTYQAAATEPDISDDIDEPDAVDASEPVDASETVDVSEPVDASEPIDAPEPVDEPVERADTLAPLPGETSEPATVDQPAELPGDSGEPTDVGVGPELPVPMSIEEAAEGADADEAGEPVDAPVAPGAAIPAQSVGGREVPAAVGEPETRTDGDGESEKPQLDDAELRAALEAILLVVDEPVAEMQLAQITEQPTERVAAMLEDISARYTAAGHGFDLRRAAGGWRLYTRPEYAAYVERFVLDGQSVRLTQAALETLAVVAYKQPVTRSRISAIRGVNCDGVMRTLATRGLIEECGIEYETGAHLYRTTALFLEKLGLNSVDQLPPLAPFLPDDVEEVLDASG